MAISPKPKPKPPAEDSNVDIDALIRRGGSVAENASALPPAAPNGAKKVASVVLRVPQALLDQIDASLDQRPVRVPRHTWLMEALVEKLEREQEPQI